MNPPLELPRKTLTGAAPGPHLLITAGVHGDEWEPMQAVRRLAAELPRELLGGRVTLVPVVNGAAFERGRRTAEDGLDLARVCPGRDDGSITERIAAALSRLIGAADYYIDLHTAGTVFRMLPLSGYCLHADLQIRARQQQMARDFGLPIVWGTNARLDGRSLSVARDAGVPAIYTEYGGGGMCDPAGVDAYVAGCRRVAASLGLIAAQPPALSPKYVVEDDRDQSGHLQVQLTAPRAGFFEPAVQLEQRVEPGQLLGRILDPLGESPLEIRGNSSGVVLLLRSYPSARAGDPLAVILPISEPGSVSFAREEVTR